jgi:23S rRNA (guanosine2251-2'-O)-methyltransferase
VRGDTIEEITSLAGQNGIPVSFVERERFRELSAEPTTQGVIAIVAPKAFVDLEAILESVREKGEKGFLLVLDEIEDPHNLGALIRTAECAGVHGVVLPRHHAATVTPAVVKTAAGATEHIALAEVTNIVATIEHHKEEGYWVVGLDAGGDREYTSLQYDGPSALVVGNEGRGIRRLVREHCDHLVRIPLFGKIRSLNASVAGAIAMYEVARQRQSGKTGRAG